MGDLKNRQIIITKGLLFLLLGILSLALVIFETVSIRVSLLMIVAIWAFCRFYYFMFYVIEKYVDKDYKFSGIVSFISYLLTRQNGRSL